MNTTWWSSLDRRRANVVVGVGALIAVVTLVLFAVQLRGTQASERQHLVSRFKDRAVVISALTQAVLGAAAASSDTARQYGSATVSGRVLDRVAAQGFMAYAVLLDQHGLVIASSRNFSPADRAQVLASQALAMALAGAPVSLSDVLPGGPGGAGRVDFDVTLKTD